MLGGSLNFFKSGNFILLTISRLKKLSSISKFSLILRINEYASILHEMIVDKYLLLILRIVQHWHQPLICMVFLMNGSNN